MKKCPKCGSTNLTIEKSLFGYGICNDCGYTWQHAVTQPAFVGFKANDNVFIEAHFEHEGRECLVLFGRQGYRCGYVSLKENEIVKTEMTWNGRVHKGIDYSRFGIECHGELTFGNYINEDYKTKNKAFVGFDCSHYMDGQDLELAKKYGLLEFPSLYTGPDWPVVSLNACIADCKSIAKQLNEFKEEVK